jgi:hypothetical protein
MATTKPKKTWKRGRQPKPKAEKQSERVVVYLTPAEAKRMRADSDKAGGTPSAFLTGLWREWRESRED